MTTIYNKNDRYVKQNLNTIEQYVVDSITNNDKPKLQKCLEYKNVDVKKCVNDKGTTLLHYAAAKKDVNALLFQGGSIVHALIQSGADVFAQDNNGKTPYDYAIEKSFMVNANILKEIMEKTKK